MPSGAKKRKAAKNKLLKEAHYNNTATNFHGSHSLGNDKAKSHVERKSNGGEVERESSEEPVVNNHAEVNEEVSLGERNVTEFAKKEKLEGTYNDVSVNVREIKNGELKKSSSSSSSSSSDGDEIAVDKENPVVEEACEAEKQVPSSLPKASRENPVISEVVYNSVEESIPVDESNAENECEFENSSIISHLAELEMKQNSDEVVPSVHEEVKVSPGMTDFVEEMIETKVIQVVDEGSEKLSRFVNMTAKDGESLLSQSSGVTSADASCGDNQVKESETHKYVEEQPFISSAPLPVRRTSWTNCCGLFEVFLGGASR